MLIMDIMSTTPSMNRIDAVHISPHMTMSMFHVDVPTVIELVDTADTLHRTFIHIMLLLHKR